MTVRAAALRTIGVGKSTKIFYSPEPLKLVQAQ